MRRIAAGLALVTLASVARPAGAVPVVASDALTLSGPPGTVDRSPPTAAYGDGVYLVAWLEMAVGMTVSVHGVTITPGTSLDTTRVSTPFAVSIGTIAVPIRITSAYDGANFRLAVPNGDPASPGYFVFDVTRGGSAMQSFTAMSPFVGSRIAIACGGPMCAIAGSTVHDGGGLLVMAPGPTMSSTFAFQQGLFDLPSIAWSGHDYRVAFDSLDTFAMDLSQVPATIDSASTPVELGTDSSPIRAARIACDRSDAVCFVTSDDDVPGIDVHGALADADGSSRTGRFNFPEAVGGRVRYSPDVGFHGPQFLLAWVDADNGSLSRTIQANFYEKARGFVDPAATIVPEIEGPDRPAIASNAAGQSIVAYDRFGATGGSAEIALRFVPPLECPPNCVDAGTDAAVDATTPDTGSTDGSFTTIPAVRYRGSGCSCAVPLSHRSRVNIGALAAAATLVSSRRRRRH